MRIIGSLFLCAIAYSAGYAATITVNLNGGADHFTIQDALNAAADGDVIEVALGTYLENIVVSKAVTVRGRVPGSVEVFSATNSGAVITVSAAATIQDLIVHGPSSVNSGITITGGGVLIRGCEVHTVSAGISISGDISGTVEIDQCTIHDINGPGITYLNAKGTVNVSRTECHHNAVGIQGGSRAPIEGLVNHLNLRNSILHNNTGGGVRILSNVFYSNPIYVRSFGDAEIINSVIYGNGDWGILGGKGGSDGTRISHPPISLESCIIADNNGGVSSSHSESRSAYSCYWGNGTNVSDGIQLGLGDIETDPLFEDEENADFRLSPGSPAIDAGRPGQELVDGDGSRNDMGAYGGPMPLGSGDEGEPVPVVTDVEVEPNPVEKGQTITIRAKARIQ